MNLLATDLIDVDALLHVALYGFVGGLGLVAAFSTLVVGYDRVESLPRRGAWPVVVVLSGLLCLVIVAVGFWAMTQKPS
jgi:fluoride ion exporter CrcB/FEX